MKRILVGALLVPIFIACSSSPSPQEGSSLACDHFRNVMGDVSKGILSDSELRAKLQQVNSDADIGTQAVQSAATQLLAADTNGTEQDLINAAKAMDQACSDAGH